MRSKDQSIQRAAPDGPKPVRGSLLRVAGCGRSAAYVIYAASEMDYGPTYTDDGILPGTR